MTNTDTNEKKNFVEFCYLKNQMISFGDGRGYPIPHRTIMKTVNTTVGNREALIPSFDLSKRHRISFEDVTPVLPTREDGMSDEFFRALCDEAHRIAIEARQSRSEVVKRINHYAKTGIIEIVSDPSQLCASKPPTAAELGVAGIPVQKPQTAQETAKQIINKEIARSNRPKKSGSK